MNKVLSKNDWLIMETLWAGKQMFLSEIMKSMNKAVEWKHPTYVTYLKRLSEAGFVRFDTISSMRRYEAAVTREQCVEHETKGLREKFSEQSTRLVLASLIRESGLNDDEFEELKTLISDMQSGD